MNTPLPKGGKEATTEQEKEKRALTSGREKERNSFPHLAKESPILCIIEKGEVREGQRKKGGLCRKIMKEETGRWYISFQGSTADKGKGRHL